MCDAQCAQSAGDDVARFQCAQAQQCVCIFLIKLNWRQYRVCARTFNEFFSQTYLTFLNTFSGIEKRKKKIQFQRSRVHFDRCGSLNFKQILKAIVISAQASRKRKNFKLRIISEKSTNKLKALSHVITSLIEIDVGCFFSLSICCCRFFFFLEI